MNKRSNPQRGAVAGALLVVLPALAPAQTSQPASPGATSTLQPATREAQALPSLAPLVESVKGAVVNVDVQSRGEGNEEPGGGQNPFFDRFFGGEDPRSGRRREQPIRQGTGSGFIIDPKGLVLTNNHVVQGAVTIRVRLDDGRSFDAEIVGRDPLTDVAVIQLQDAPKNLPFVALGDSDAVRVGDFVLAIGNPFGLASSVSSGILSARARDIHAGPYDDFLQTDAAINPGNSGGPLFNLKGEVVGMNTAIVREATGIGFAVPSNLIHSLLPRLEKDGLVRRGWLGLAAQDLTPDLAKALQLDVAKGAVIADLSPGSPGARAGLQDNDVITRVDDTPIVSAGSLTRTVGLLTPDSRVTVHVLREGKPVEVAVVLGTRPAQKGEPRVPSRDDEQAPAKGRLGMRLADDPEGQGVRVVQVEPGSPADRAELPPGTLLPSSAKLERFGQLVEDLVAEGHRALVFSQFTEMLELLKGEADRRGMGYLYLDGRTKDRMGKVDEFNRPDGPPLFFISLKAGGTGLNLTAADYVIHYDPWWNPAVEAQATDRAHRIGQTRPVTVYRLVARGTIEEQILSLHGDKRALVAGVLEGTGGALAALVMTGRVTEPAGQPRPHGLEHFAARGGGRRVIQVDHDVTSRDDGHVVPVTGDEPDCKDGPWKKTR